MYSLDHYRVLHMGNWKLLHWISFWPWCVVQLYGTKHFELSWWIVQALLCAKLWITWGTKSSQCIDFKKRLWGLARTSCFDERTLFLASVSKSFSPPCSFPFNCFFSFFPFRMHFHFSFSRFLIILVPYWDVAEMKTLAGFESHLQIL